MGNFIKWVVGVLVGEEIFTGFLDYLNLSYDFSISQSISSMLSHYII